MLHLILSLVVSGQTLTVDAAKQQIEKIIAASGAEVAVAYRPLDSTSGDILIDVDKTFHAASTM